MEPEEVVTADALTIALRAAFRPDGAGSPPAGRLRGAARGSRLRVQVDGGDLRITQLAPPAPPVGGRMPAGIRTSSCSSAEGSGTLFRRSDWKRPRRTHRRGPRRRSGTAGPVRRHLPRGATRLRGVAGQPWGRWPRVGSRRGDRARDAGAGRGPAAPPLRPAHRGRLGPGRPGVRGPDEPVDHVLFAVDPELAVAHEAIADGAQLLVTHHPLLLTGVHGVPAQRSQGRGRPPADPCRGRTAGGAHERRQRPTRASRTPSPRRSGVFDTEPLDPLPAGSDALDKLIVFVPHDSADALIDALAAAGAGRIGDYDRAAFTAPGTGTFRPLAGANPTIGAIGRIEQVPETMIQMVRPADAAGRGRRGAAGRASLRGAGLRRDRRWPRSRAAGTGRGGGRVGELAEPMSLRELRRARRGDAAGDRSRSPCGR